LDTYNYAPFQPSYAMGVAVDQNDDLVVIGYGLSSNRARWLVRRITTGGAFLSDDFEPLPGGTDSHGFAVAVHPSGSLFAAGIARDSSANHWITRRLAAP
jgi:hypothetical protein